MNLRIAFTRDSGPISRLIRWFTNGRVSHVAILNEEDGVTYVYEAWWSGFTKTPWSKWKLKEKVFTCPPLKVSLDAAEEEVKTWVGRPYGYWGLLYQIPVNILRVLRLKLHAPLSNSRALICSEAGARVLKKCGYPPHPERLEPEVTSPEALLDYMELP